MTADRAQRDPTPEQIMDELSPSARRCLRSMAGTPDDAAGWYNRLADVRAAMKVGVEVMEQSAREEAQAAGAPTGQSNMKMIAASYALGATTALECCMSIIERLHPSLIKGKVGGDPIPPGSNGHTLPNDKIRRMELD